MDSKKLSNLLRAVADLMDETTEVVQETQKDVTKTIEKNTNDYLEHSLKLIKKLEESDSIRAYKNKLTKQNKTLADALVEIQKLREKTIEDMLYEYRNVKDPIDLMTKTINSGKKFGEHVAEEGKILTKTLTQE